MKILHIITSLRTGGAEKLMVDLLPRLRDAGHQVDLMVFDGVNTPFKTQLEHAGIKIISCRINQSVYHPGNIIKLRRVLSSYDVVHTHNYAPQIFVAIASLGKKVRLVTTEHGGSNRRRSYRWFAKIDRWMYSRYDKVIGIADKTLANLQTFIGNDLTNTIVVNNGVDVERFANAEPSDILEQIAPSSKKIIMVAGFRWEKDQDTLIKAIQYLPDAFHLFLVGDGIRRVELENFASNIGVAKRVHFMGIRSDIPELLHAADYIVMSSHFEGLSLSSVEGMSVGKPFFASDVDGLREVVVGAGILFPHQDAKALAQSILNVANSPEEYSRVSQLCIERASRYDIAKMCAQYNEVYYSLENI